MDEFVIKTEKKEEIVDLTSQVKEIVEKSKFKKGICYIYVPHATAALTINENYDENVCLDFLNFLDKAVPQGKWLHDKVDSNGAAHIKAAIIGPSEFIPICDGKLMLGTWQGIMFCEFDGPRDRRVIVEIR
jgi:secondary thiamine-phosphate synthase enzyme